MLKENFRKKISDKMIFFLKRKDGSIFKDMPLEELLIWNLLSKPVPKDIKDIQECHNQIVWIRRVTPYLLEECREHKRKLGPYTDLMVMIYARLEHICKLYDEVDLPMKEFIQVAGLNEGDVKTFFNKYFYGIHKGMSNYMSYLNDGIESERTKYNEGFKWNRNGMPLFDLTTSFLIDYVIPKYKEQVGEKQYYDEFSNLFDNQLPIYTLKEDEDGNKTLEQYYPRPKLIKGGK